MTIPRIKQARYEYEFLNTPREIIADKYGMQVESLNIIIEEGAWIRKMPIIMDDPTPDSSQMTISGLKEYAETLKEQTQARLTVIGLRRQVDLQPLLASLDQDVVQKCKDILGQVDNADPKAAQQVKTLVDTLKAIEERQPVQLAAQVTDALSSNQGVKVYIQANVGDSDKGVVGIHKIN